MMQVAFFRMRGIAIALLFILPQKALAQQVFHLIPAGNYVIGGEGNIQNPRRRVQVDSFYISEEITNQDFARFVNEAGYITDAGRNHRAMVFEPGLKEFQWLQDSTACWRNPNGSSRGGIESKQNHPVTTISYADAEAYCKWAGGRLPTLTEWEVAARGGSETRYYWGDDAAEIGRYANIWHARNHLLADSSDGYLYTAPIGQFKPNAFGLHDMYGNVFEFCSGTLPADKCNQNIVHARGGSWWCSKNTCNFFNSEDIGRVNRHASFSNQGFRMVKGY